MSLTTNQIEELRAYAKDRKGELARLINDAADTIELLSAKLHASQMERSSQYYHGGWIPCSETVDIPDHEVLCCDGYGEEMFGYLAYEDEQWLCASDGCVMYDPIAWCEKPEPYRYREEGDA
jgi:hypothetical protein